jgi:hypothetical protein
VAVSQLPPEMVATDAMSGPYPAACRTCEAGAALPVCATKVIEDGTGIGYKVGIITNSNGIVTEFAGPATKIWPLYVPIASPVMFIATKIVPGVIPLAGVTVSHGTLAPAVNAAGFPSLETPIGVGC